MNKKIKIIVIIILVQIILVLTGWMYQKTTGNKISNHLYELSQWYDRYKEKAAKEKYQKAHEKWWNSMTTDQKANYQREIAEIDDRTKKLKLASENNQEFKNCIEKELPENWQDGGRYSRILADLDEREVCGRRLGIIGVESELSEWQVGLKYKKPQYEDFE